MATRLVESPPRFDGTLSTLFEEHVQHVLPPVEEVEWLHRLFVEHVRGPDPAFIVRRVAGLDRGRLFRTSGGHAVLPSDNAPAWWIHHVAFNRLRPKDLNMVPTHMFEVARTAPANINTAGWHVAHIFDAKDGNTDWMSWTHHELLKRFIRNIHPCNCFYVPKPSWRTYGGDRRVVAFFAHVNASRYRSVWQEFMQLADARPLGPGDGSARYLYPRSVSPAHRGPPACGAVAASYRSTRLAFRADVIEPLLDEQAFEVITPSGVFRMTKAEFHRDFPAVVRSISYRERRLYHYPQIPKAALRYRT